MKFIDTSEDFNTSFLEAFRRHSFIYGILSGANSNFPYFFEFSDLDGKIKQLCIGLFQTDTSPTFINEFFTSENVRYFYPARGLTLMNLIMFYSSPDDWSIFCGNFIFDQASFTDQPIGVWSDKARNEHSQLIAANVIRQVDYYFNRSFRFTEEEYETYWKLWDRSRPRGE